ncbi:MAG: segregation/condensation protein A [Nitrospirae bacterium]|nr:segregation/condensation protein A [Candidatus Troglogloeales bacterium]
METDSGLGVKVGAFEGSLELLLHLIQENQINIYDIPIALITQQYLETLEQMTSLKLSVAGDFLVMAATLIHIKSKMLLPVYETDEEEALEEDPRHELVARLLEYQKFKEAAGTLESYETIWRQVFVREALLATASDPSEEIFLGDVGVHDLLKALQKVIERLPNKDILTIHNDELSVRDRIGFILSLMEHEKSLLFEQLFDGIETRYGVVVTFLALLEIIRLGLIKILQVENCSALRLMSTDNLVGAG